MTSKENKNTSENQGPLVFSKKNYQLLFISMGIVLLGFILMIGKEGDIYDTRRTLIAPMVVLAGFGFGIYAILKK
ncbi:MAG: DUF3098 domain-containing protein [Pedobacter sp.]|nr:MAG: DUF3098 domain-containing protein [Pedobacter sp.]